jgi:hypothetical protein
VKFRQLLIGTTKKCNLQLHSLLTTGQPNSFVVNKFLVLTKDYCEKKEATCGCDNCVGMFCSNCFENQHRIKLFQSHKKTNLSEVSSKCINHQNKPSELFCFTDESFICSHCAIFKHKEHDCVGLEKATERLKNSLNSSLKDEDFKKLESSIKKVYSFISLRNEKYKKDFSFRNEKYKEDLKLLKDEYVKDSTDFEGAMKNLKENLNKMEELTENLNLGDIHCLLKMKKEDLSFMGISKNNIELIRKIEKMNLNDLKLNKEEIEIKKTKPVVKIEKKPNEDLKKIDSLLYGYMKRKHEKIKVYKGDGKEGIQVEDRFYEEISKSKYDRGKKVMHKEKINLFKTGLLTFEFKQHTFTKNEIEEFTKYLDELNYFKAENYFLFHSLLDLIKGKWMYLSAYSIFYTFIIKNSKNQGKIDLVSFLLWHFEERVDRSKYNAKFILNHGKGFEYYKTKTEMDGSSCIINILRILMDENDVGQLVVFILWLSIDDTNFFSLFCQSFENEFSPLFLAEPIVFILDAIIAILTQKFDKSVSLDTMKVDKKLFNIQNIGHYFKCLDVIFKSASEKLNQK